MSNGCVCHVRVYGVSGGGVKMFVALFLFVAGFLLYFFPSIVAYLFKHKNVNAITVLNLCLGWTILGWVGALIWAILAEEKK